MARDLKAKLADYLLELDREGIPEMIRLALGADRIEVDRLGDYQAQVKVWPQSGGAPRYFTLRLSESL